MKLRLASLAAALAVAFVVPTLHADVKTREKILVKLGGALGSMSKMFGGSAAKDGVTTTLALKGQRKSSMGDANGEIVDLGAEVVYRVDLRKKEYKIVTFAQLRKEWQEAQDEAKKGAEELRRAQAGPGDKPVSEKEYEFTADVKETGQRKILAGHDTREVIVTITGREKGKTLEEAGGFVLTNTLWLGPRIAALDELTQFDLRFLKAIAGDEGAAQIQQLAAAFIMFPQMKPMMDQLRAEGGKLQGSPLLSTTVFENIKSAEQLKAASAETSGGGGGGGLSGKLAGRFMRGRGQSSEPRSTVFSTTRELLSVDPSATDADVAIPAGFKEKK